MYNVVDIVFIVNIMRFNILNVHYPVMSSVWISSRISVL